MVDINSWMAQLIEKLEAHFGRRLLFVGLQGSYQRGEAHEGSDIDAVVILDRLTMDELVAYRDILAALPKSDKACGFIAGRDEVQSWPKHELFQFVNDTRALYGHMEDFLPPIDKEDVVESVKIGAATLYHAAVHGAVHGAGDMQALRALYKSAFFLLQAVHYLRTAHYVRSKRELLPLLEGAEQKILGIEMAWSDYEEDAQAHPDGYYGLLIALCGGLINATF